MHKIRKSVIDEILLQKCTGAEIKFLLFISQYQSKHGTVRHVRCKDICLAIGISKQTFYNILKSLQEKKVIRVLREVAGEYSVTILNNAFLEYKDYGKGKGYITSQYDFLHESTFHGLKANAKRLALKMLRVLYNKDKSFSARYKVFLQWVGIKNKRILMGYLEALEEYFVIYYHKDYCTFCLRRKHPAEENRYKKTETYKYLHYRMSHICRKFKICYTTKDLQDYISLFWQYPDKRKRRKLFFAFIKTVSQLKMIQPALIHSIIKVA